MPDEMSFAIGAFVEPMACVVHAMNQLELQVGQRVLLLEPVRWDSSLCRRWPGRARLSSSL